MVPLDAPWPLLDPFWPLAVMCTNIHSIWRITDTPLTHLWHYSNTQLIFPFLPFPLPLLLSFPPSSPTATVWRWLRRVQGCPSPQGNPDQLTNNQHQLTTIHDLSWLTLTYPLHCFPSSSPLSTTLHIPHLFILGIRISWRTLMLRENNCGSSSSVCCGPRASSQASGHWWSPSPYPHGI